MAAKTTWVVVADGARAHFYVADGGTLSAALDHDLVAPSRNLAHDAETERPGRSFDSVGHGRHAIEPPTDWKTLEKQQLATDVADELRHAAERKAFDRLIVVAPPEMLGLLRDAFDAAVGRLVEREIGKDLTQLDLHDLREHLREALAA